MASDIGNSVRKIAFTGNYLPWRCGIGKITIMKDNPFREKPIRDLKPQLEDALILAIYRTTGKKTNFIGAPHGDVILKINDELICYAKADAISKIFAPAKL